MTFRSAIRRAPAVDRAPGGAFLPEGEQAAGEDDGQDDHPVGDVPHHHRHDGRADEDQDDRTGELPEQQPQAPVPPGRLDPVRAVTLEPCGGLLVGQPGVAGAGGAHHVGQVARPERACASAGGPSSLPQTGSPFRLDDRVGRRTGMDRANGGS